MGHQHHDPSVLPFATGRLGVPLEQCVLGLGVERSGGFVEHEDQWIGAHVTASQRELLPLAERDVDPVLPRRTELRVETVAELFDEVVGPGSVHGVLGGRTIVAPGFVAEADGGDRSELQRCEVLERAGHPSVPCLVRHPGDIDAVRGD